MPSNRMGMCAGCGGVLWVDVVDITRLGQNRTYMDGRAECEDCGGSMEARWDTHPWPEMLVINGRKRYVHAGPPAPYPHVPDHAEWLAAWGFDPGRVA